MLRVEIEWLDSGSFYTGEGWSTKDHITSVAKLSEVITVGHLFHEDDFAYFVALSYDPENQHFYGTQVIAKNSVIRFTRLRARTGSPALLNGEDSDDG
jgi:hypothetical protein